MLRLKVCRPLARLPVPLERLLFSKLTSTRWLVPLTLIPAGLSLYAAAGIPAAPSDLVSILSGELTREFDVLKAKGDPPPYYMAYEVTDDESNAESASLGALVNNVHNHERGVDTTVRVGSAKFDNYHPFKGQRIRFTRYAPLSLDDDANQIRRVLWSESDRVYKLGSRRLLQLKTDDQLLAAQSQTDADFSVEPAVAYTKLPETYNFDAAEWAAKLRAWSAEFKSHPKIIESNVSYRALREIRTFVNTEGSKIQLGSNLFRLEVGGGAIAPDGMQLQTFTTIEASEPGHLPPDEVVRTKVRELANKLDALVNAPPAEPIVCPAILSGRASAVFFHEIFGHRVEGHRQKDISEGQTFTKMLGTKVLPSFISVDFDATRSEYQGTDLMGHYDYDDEGVKARPVKVVDNGVLKTFLLSRSPVGEFVQSNGHGRRQPGFEIVSRQSNLIVESSKKVSNEELRAQLVEEIRRQGKPYGLYFEEVSSGYTTTGRQGLQAFTVVPLVVYRVFPDRRPDELIRGVDIVGTPLASFQKIIATSDKSEVFNGYCGAESGSIPVSAISPAILVSEIETQKKENSQQKQPLLPRPEGE
jgi:predicted Zn-dependent protease